MPTTRSYTSMTSDPSGLFYDHARYYDSGVGQFTAADTVQGPNRYGYVAGNPETNTDPTGNSIRYWYWWGEAFRLSEWETHVLTNKWLLIAATFALVAAICGPFFGPCAILFVILAAYAGWFSQTVAWVDDLGHDQGIWLDFTWWFSMGVRPCWSPPSWWRW